MKQSFRHRKTAKQNQPQVCMLYFVKSVHKTFPCLSFRNHNKLLIIGNSLSLSLFIFRKLFSNTFHISHFTHTQNYAKNPLSSLLSNIHPSKGPLGNLSLPLSPLYPTELTEFPELRHHPFHQHFHFRY